MLKCVLEHVDDPGSILKEASRVLKINGTMIIEVPLINPIHASELSHRYYQAYQ